MRADNDAVTRACRNVLSPGWRPFIALLVLSLGCAAAQDPKTPQENELRVLTSAREAHSLTSEEAARAYPVHLRAVATYYDPYLDSRHGALFVHDSTGAIFVAVPSRPILPIRAGSMVEVWGRTGAGDFAPMMDSTDVRVIGASHVPAEAPRASLARLLTGAYDFHAVLIKDGITGVVNGLEDDDHAKSPSRKDA